ncbi:MAG: cytochrome b5-like heme/steroid binding domain-containing protein [Nanoarchaeota archaeon]|mgnify:CR=1 FL=1
MKKIWIIFIIAFIAVNAVAFSVFLTGNSQQGNSLSNAINQQNKTGNSQDNNPITSGSISSSELSKHSKQSDCWISYKGKVYDLTKWLPKHPGSAAAIAPYCGTSSEFEKAFSDKHGTSQVQRMVAEGIYKGELK